MRSREHNYYVYIMTNRSKTLYTGVTNNLTRRIWSTSRARDPAFAHIMSATTTREKQIKGWLRIKKIASKGKWIVPTAQQCYGT